jgi:hypothetical protein
VPKAPARKSRRRRRRKKGTEQGTAAVAGDVAGEASADGLAGDHPAAGRDPSAVAAGSVEPGAEATEAA